MLYKAKPGDNVIFVGNERAKRGPRGGMIGKIIVAQKDGLIGVEFNSKFDGGHMLGRRIEDERGWWCLREQLDAFVEYDDDITITIDDKLLNMFGM